MVQDGKEKISVAIIAKNESELVDQCLQSVQELNEIVFVDTGSTDKTVEIAKAFNVKPFYHAWNDNFSEARNFARSKCTGDWILSIDADEILLDAEDVVRSAVLANGDKKSLDVKILGSTGDYFYFPRLTRNTSEVYWKGAVHNYMTPRRGEANSGLTLLGVRSPAHEGDSNRTVRILEKELERDPSLIRERYYLAREYVYNLRWDEALELLEVHTKNCTFVPERAEAYLMMAKIHNLKKEMYAARLFATRAVMENKNFKEALEFLAFLAKPCDRNFWLRAAQNANNEDVLFVRSRSWLSLID